ncbi:glycoside hydrolase family 2 protein [Persicitalea jodogahamensis]|uniref:Beta-mannosidase B n=1 Tax=Persicitalea jodogahamensis TaxID=402147 RepID=A0A8J3GB42_9BACT|nr:sugar-binding domain-containing protein [Persicitalea jodogahamensis]GHB75012.1 beta-mannosidase [Persicitalea jodogahamensis]
MKYLVLLVSTCFAFLATAQPGIVISHEENRQAVRDLTGYEWKMKMMLPGEGVKAGLHKLPPEDIETLVWNAAQVPGDVYTDLWKCGAIDDPYFGRNSVKAQWVQHYEWWYATQFDVTTDLTDQLVWLNFEGVDYSCEVWLNGQYLGKHEGAFSGFSFEVTKAIRSSKLRLKNRNILMVKLDPPPQVNALVAGRKTPWFGDYWRDLIPFGITRPINMVMTGASRITDLFAKTKINTDGSATVDLEIEVNNTSKNPLSITATSSIEGENFSETPRTQARDFILKPGKNKIVQTYEIPDPKLWWPWDLGDQNLYKAKVSITQNKVNHDVLEKVFGIREVKMEWNPGFTRDEVSFPRTTTINGKFHFIRSACWGGPPDIFVGRTSVDEYKKLIDLAKAANMNNIRIFGWHPPEIPEFYEYCDRAGLTVWQDVIPLGTGNVPQDREFIDRTIGEGIAVIKERRNHPSLIMMEGGEEMFLRATDPKFTLSLLEEFRDSLHTYVNLPFVPDSPMTDEASQEAGFKPKEAVHALAYFYSMGNWPMEEWFRTMDYPIVPEFAITSVPSVESLKKFIPENEMWPPGLSWGHHWADLDHLRAQNFDTFGDQKTGSLEEFVNATQDSQGIIFQLGIEYFRRHKPRLSGIALCHFITYWPDMKWGIVDNYQQTKWSYDFVKTAYQPLLVNLNFEKRRWANHEPFKGEVWVVNDLYKRYPDCTIKVDILDSQRRKLSSTSHKVAAIEENSAAKLFDIQENVLGKVSDKFHIHLSLTDKNGKELSANDYMMLIGDQRLAARKFKEMGTEIRRKNGKFKYGNYYQFFPALIEGTYDSQTQNPRAEGFPKSRN